MASGGVAGGDAGGGAAPGGGVGGGSGGVAGGAGRVGGVVGAPSPKTLDHVGGGDAGGVGGGGALAGGVGGGLGGALDGGDGGLPTPSSGPNSLLCCSFIWSIFNFSCYFVGFALNEVRKPLQTPHFSDSLLAVCKFRQTRRIA